MSDGMTRANAYSDPVMVEAFGEGLEIEAFEAMAAGGILQATQLFALAERCRSRAYRLRKTAGEEA